MIATSAGRTYSEPAMGTGRCRQPSSGSPSSMRTRRAGEPALLIPEKFDWVSRHVKVDALGQSVVNLFNARWHLGLRAAIDQLCRARTRSPYCADRVHRSVTAAHDNHVAIATVVHRLIIFKHLVGMDQVYARRKFVGGVDAVKLLPRRVEDTDSPARQ
jgi:hypothetical protein